jgi:uncharacterized membrane protein
MNLFGVYVFLAVVLVLLVVVLVLPRLFVRPVDYKSTDRRRHGERRDRDPHMLSHSDFKDTHNRREHY